MICHGPWSLVEADVVRGRRMTSWPTIRTDLRNAGAEVVDEEVVVDGAIISSRKPDDLPAFCAEIVEQFAAWPRPRSDGGLRDREGHAHADARLIIARLDVELVAHLRDQRQPDAKARAVQARHHPTPLVGDEHDH